MRCVARPPRTWVPHCWRPLRHRPTLCHRSRWGYDDLVEAHLAGILASASSLDSGDEGGASEASGGGGEG